jgi:hypothetical protein
MTRQEAKVTKSLAGSELANADKRLGQAFAPTRPLT